MSSRTPAGPQRPAHEAAMEALAVSAAGNIPGVDFVSITVHRKDGPMHTAASTDPIADEADLVQYELREGPCYAAVTHERFVRVNDIAASVELPNYAPKAVALGVRAQAGI